MKRFFFPNVLRGYKFQKSLNRMVGRMEDNTGKCAADANIASQMAMWSGQWVFFPCSQYNAEWCIKTSTNGSFYDLIEPKGYVM